MIEDSSALHAVKIVDDGEKLANGDGDLIPLHEDSDEARRKEPPCGLCGSARYIILLIAVLCMTAARANELSFNLAVICMTSNSTASGSGSLTMSAREMCALFAAGGAGAIVFVLPLIYAMHRYGARLVFATLLILSAIATAVFPQAAAIGVPWMLIARILQGIALAAVFPLIGCVSGQWAPFAEIGKFVTLLSAAMQLAQIVTMPLAAHLCVTSGWPSAYYTLAVISAALTLPYLAFYRNSPRQHPCVSNKELRAITNGEKRKRRRDIKVPLGAILRSPPVWAVWIAFVGNSTAFQLIAQFMPTYLNKVLDVPIERTGFAAIVPPVVQLVVKVLAGILSDKITFIKERRKIQMFNTMAATGTALCLLPLGYLAKGQANIALLCFTASISCMGLVTCGSMKSATLIARTFAQFVMGVIQLVVCIGMMFVPLMVSVVAPNNTIYEWRLLTVLVTVIITTTNALFCWLCSAEAQWWTNINVSEQHSTTNTAGGCCPKPPKPIINPKLARKHDDDDAYEQLHPDGAICNNHS